MSGSILQAGPIARGNVAAWLANGVVQDGSNPSAITQLRIVNTGGTAIEIDSGPQTGPFVAMQFIVSPDGIAQIAVTGLNGAAAGAFQLVLNGVVYNFPGAGNGDVSGPPSSGNGNAAIFNGVGGNLIADAGRPPVLGPSVSAIGHVAIFENVGGALIGDAGFAPVEPAPSSGAGNLVVFSGTTGAILADGGPASVPTIAALRALNCAVVGEYIVVAGYFAAADGGGGLFTYAPADIASGDNGGTIIVDALHRRWYLAFEASPSICQFGVLPTTSAASNTTRLQAALAAAVALSIPTGVFPLNAGVAVPSGAVLLGCGPGSILSVQTAGSALQLINAASAPANVEFASFQIVAAIAGVTGMQFTLAPNVNVHDMTFTGVSQSIVVDRCNNSTFTNILSRGGASLPAGGATFWSTVDTAYCQNLNIDNFQILNEGDGTGTSGFYFRRVTGCAIRALNVNDMANGNAGQGTFVVLENDSQGNKFSDCICAAVSTGLLIRQGAGVAVTPSFNQISNFDVDQVYGAYGVLIVGNYNTFRGGNVTASGVNTGTVGIDVAGAYNQVLDCQVDGFNGTNGTAINASVNAGRIARNVLTTCSVGVGVLAGAASMAIEENTFAGITTGVSGVLTATTCDIRDNIGLPSISAATPALPATGVAVTNVNPNRTRVFIEGGTFSAVAINGSAIGVAANNLSTILDPGDTIAINYSAAPTTWIWLSCAN